MKSRILLITILLAGTSGCASTGLLSWNKDKLPTADERNPAVEILCMWQPTKGRGLNGLPSRGFAGQILFFTKGSEAPVKVSGDVRIYLFDDRGSVEEQGKPIRQFDFLDDSWRVFLQAGQLGPTYRLFIPYVRNDAYESNCALRLRLTPADGGPVIYSDMITVALPGTALPQEQSAEPADLDVQAAERLIKKRLKESAEKDADAAAVAAGFTPQSPDLNDPDDMNQLVIRHETRTPTQIDPSTVPTSAEPQTVAMAKRLEEFRKYREGQWAESPTSPDGDEPGPFPDSQNDGDRPAAAIHPLSGEQIHPLETADESSPPVPTASANSDEPARRPTSKRQAQRHPLGESGDANAQSDSSKHPLIDGEQ